MVERVEINDQEIRLESLPVKGGRGITKWLIIVMVILIAASTAIFAGLKFLTVKGLSIKAQEEKAPKKAEADKVGPMFPLDPFIVNLADDDGKRYLKLTMEMELEKEDTSKELGERLAQIRDTILILLTSKTFDDIKDVAGKFKLREQITQRVNTHLTSGKIRQVYFTEFVIQ